MNKLLITTMIVCLSAFANAASVSWGGAAAYGKSCDDFAEGQTAYLIFTGASRAALASVITMNSADYTTWKVDNGGAIVDSYMLTATDVNPEVAKFTASYVNADADGGVNGYYQVIIANPEMNGFAINDVGLVSGATDQTGAFDARINMEWDSDEYIGMNGYTGAMQSGSEPVPEPTSGLLLLVGVAGMALRRRRV